MSDKKTANIEGIQFPKRSADQKPSTTSTAKQIMQAALAAGESPFAAQISSEKNWRKHYPVYFKALVEAGISSAKHPVQIAQSGLSKAMQLFVFNRAGESNCLSDAMDNDQDQPFDSFVLKGTGNQKIEPWHIPYQGQKLQGQALLAQVDQWEAARIIEPSHAQALRTLHSHPEWFDLSQRTMVLFGAASEAGPLSWLAKWRANIVAIDLPNPMVWAKITNMVQSGNATLIAPQCKVSTGERTLGANLLTQTPEIANWLSTLSQPLDMAGVAYLDGEKHVRVSMAMLAIMDKVSLRKPDSSLMFMLTPTDIYAIPAAVVHAVNQQILQRSGVETVLTKVTNTLSGRHFFQPPQQQLITSDNGKQYGMTDCMVIEQGPNYALAKRLQQWFAVIARARGQRTSINIAPSTTTKSVVKNPILKAAFAGADLFNVETFSPETTNAIMAALWVHDLNNPDCAANPEKRLDHPLELLMEGANHGGLWYVSYLARTALPFAAAYGWASERLNRYRKSSKVSDAIRGA